MAAELSLPGKTKPYVMAHRGNQVKFPENTISAFRQAVYDGADIIETDLHMTSDGHFVCIHDDKVDRTTDGRGLVAEMTLSDLRTHNAANLRPDLEPEYVPTLEEFANLIPPDVGLALELKSDIFLDADIAAGLVRQLDHLGVSQRSIVLSFSFERLEAVRTASPNIAQGWITLTKPWPRTGVEMLGPLWVLLYINPFYVRRAHRFGQLVCPLDPTPEARLGTYLRLGVDAVLSDNPAATCLALSRVRNRSV
jgi:glycerophosphoryl diester phosphodiesterase